MQGFENPIVPQALVSVNAVYDRPFYIKRTRTQRADAMIPYVGNDPHNFSAMRHELAFTQQGKTAHLSAPSQSGTGQNDLPIFTSFNGMDITGNYKMSGNTDEEREELYRKMRARVNFVGVNLTTINVQNSNRSDAVSVMIAGMVTVQNTGPFRFGNMDRVVWDVPAFGNDQGLLNMQSHYLPKTKHVALLLPYEEALKKEVDSAPSRIAAVLSSSNSKSEPLENERIFAESMSELFKVCGIPDTEMEKIAKALTNTSVSDKKNPARVVLKKLIYAARLLTSEVDSRVIGTAANSAHPGGKIDLLLRHAM